MKDLECHAKELGLDPVGSGELLKDFTERLYHQEWASKKFTSFTYRGAERTAKKLFRERYCGPDQELSKKRRCVTEIRKTF